jgi:C-terminal processing protease CtpA/Prc
MIIAIDVIQRQSRSADRNRTFSSANMCTNAVKDYHLATLIGESTAEPANDFGDIFSFMLPNTHIVATTAIKMFTRANEDEKDFTGIKPDIEVKNSFDDIRQKKDQVLEKATAWILQ